MDKVPNLKSPMANQYEEKFNVSYTCDGITKFHSHPEESLADSYKVKISLPYDSAITFLANNPLELKF